MNNDVNPIVKVKNISKSFSGVRVLNNIDFNIYSGEVHAILGENGAGKSTLVKIISGVYTPTEGQIYFNDQPVKILSPKAAHRLGISMIHQEPLTFPDLNVTENIFVGHTRDEGGAAINWMEKQRKARELLDSLEVSIDEKAVVRGMSIADQQMVEITCALSHNAKVIIMDEPTAALSLGEVKTLFTIVRKLKEQGKAIVFIGHRLEEVEEISDRITVLRDGEKVGERITAETSQEQMVKMMIGRTVKEQIHKEEVEKGDVLLEVDNLTLQGKFNDISFKIRKGEVVGFAGLVGAGRTEVAKAIFGITPAESGSIKYAGNEVIIDSPQKAINLNIAMVPEDRAIQGLILPMSVLKNTTYTILKRLSTVGWLKFKQEKKYVKEYVTKLNIRLRDIQQPAKELSGGNQQKVVLSKWLLTEPDFLILDEPTRGIDVGAKVEVYKLINKLAREGKAIMMISSELPEIMSLSDRIYVMSEGRMTAELRREEANEEKIMSAASISRHREVKAV